MTTRIGILGAGGLGKGMARVLSFRKKDFTLVAMADSQGYCYSQPGLEIDALLPLGSVVDYPEGLAVHSANAIEDLLSAHGEDIDALFLALPNLPVEFFAETVTAIAKTPFQGVIVDALKRTKAVELLLPLDSQLRGRRILHITGGGATPGFLTTIAAVAAQSFVAVESVNIHFGVGIENWEAYRATIREDFLHLPGFDAERVAAMSDEDIQAELDKRNGVIELVEMEHADDIILELAGICARDRVTVGGRVDTRNAKKPVSTTVTVTGRTAFGKIGSHTFTVSDETTMVDNVCGPALGFLARGLDLHKRGTYGLMTSADLMPKFVSTVEISSPGGRGAAVGEALPSRTDAVRGG